MLTLLNDNILLLIAIELVPLLCINFVSVKLSVKLFECYYGPLDALTLVGVISTGI